MDRKTLLIGLVVVLAFLVFIFRGYWQSFFPNVNTPGGEPTEFFIHTGWDYTQVGEKLKDRKLINDLEAFHWLAEEMNYPRHVYPGRYIIEDGMSTRELITLLRSGSQTPIRFTFVKFRTKEQLATFAAERLEMTQRQLLDVLNDEEFLNKYSGLDPETALTVFIPNTYELYWNIDPRSFFERMYKEYRRFWNDDRNERRRKWGLNRLEVMVLASIVEEETTKDDEKAAIAGVYLNRIRTGMPLQADPTVKYAVGDFTIRRILNKHLETDSPYNTYLYRGLPPAPICTPSISSIEAVLNGERHSYFYFCAKADGSGYHHFSKTLAEHQRYAAQYQSMLNQQRIMN